MGVIATIRRAGATAGKVLDTQDRKFLAQLAIWGVAIVTMVLGGAATIGLAVRLFNLAAGW